MAVIDFLLEYFTPFGWTEPQVKVSEPPKPVQVVQRGSLPQILKVGHNVETGAPFEINLKDYEDSGERDAILASSGMGKSYLAGVLLEETLETGGLVCVIDPEGEWYTLADRYPLIVAGGDHATVTLEPSDEEKIEEVLRTVLTRGVSVVFDLSDMIEGEQTETYAIIAEKLFELENSLKTKIRLVVEEAQVFAPQTGAGGSKEGPNSLSMSQHVAKRGRKRALDSLWATQRPASINKNILTQCNRFWFGGITAEQDYKAIKSFLDTAGVSFDQIKALKRGQFYFSTTGKPAELVQVRKRYCKHGGGTPKRQVNVPRATKEDLQGILAQWK